MSKEKEILSIHTGLAISDEFFSKKKALTEEDLLPAMRSLMKQCDGIITQAGLYAIRLQIVKLK